MPLYRYVCQRCSQDFEIRQTFEEFDKHPLDECPACGGRIEQVFSPNPVIFHGSGFYTTDSRENMVRAESGAMGHLVSETDERIIEQSTKQRATSKGKPLATPTRPKNRIT